MRIDFPNKPTRYEIVEQIGDKWSVNLRENIEKDENYQSPFMDVIPRTITDEDGNIINVPFDETMTQSQEMWYADCYIGHINADIEDKEAYIEEHFDELIAQAKGEDKASEIRAMRDELLNQSDKYMMIDRYNSLEELQSVISGDIAQYRQALRDITKQKGFPYEVEWPVKPNNIK